MSQVGFQGARELTIKGFYYENLMEMAAHCRDEEHLDRILCAFVLNRFFMKLAQELGDGPVLSTELRKWEVSYRTPSISP